jgi:hypothetical protein
MIELLNNRNNSKQRCVQEREENNMNHATFDSTTTEDAAQQEDARKKSTSATANAKANKSLLAVMPKAPGEMLMIQLKRKMISVGMANQYLCSVRAEDECLAHNTTQHNLQNGVFVQQLVSQQEVLFVFSKQSPILN